MKTIYWIAGTIVLVVCLVLFMNGCFDKKKIIQQLATGIEHRDDTTTHWRESDGTEHAKIISLQEDIQTAKILHKKEMDDVTHRLGIKDKQIEGLNKLVANLQGSFTEQVDTSQRGDTTASIFHIDPFSTFNTFTIDGKETVKYKIRVPIHLAQYWKRPHSFLGIKFGDPVHYLDGYSDNKNVTLDSLSNVRILTKKPGRWGAGPFVGFGTTGDHFTWAAGISIHYSLIRW